MNIGRQTALTLAELEDELRLPVSRYNLPACLIANEIGEIAADPNDSDSTHAAEELVRLLTDARDDVRYVAYCWLRGLFSEKAPPSMIPVVDAINIVKAILEFEALAQNEQIVKNRSGTKP